MHPINALQPQTLDALLALRDRIYGDHPYRAYADGSLRIGFSLLNPDTAQVIQEKDGDTLLGMAILYPSARPDEGYFGFFEHSGSVAQIRRFGEELLLVAHALGWQRLLGPVNGSTFLPYRFTTESEGDESLFVGEMLDRPEYGQAFLGLTIDDSLEYASAYRTYFDGVIEVSRPYLQKFMAAGIQFIEQDTVSADLAQRLYGMSEAVFGNKWGFEPIDFGTFGSFFFDLANSDATTYRLRPGAKLFLIQLGDAILGFALLQVNHDGALIVKTVGLSPEHQAKGIGNAFVAWVHEWAKERDFGKCIYALIQVDNRVSQMPRHDAVIFRKYRSFEFAL